MTRFEASPGLDERVAQMIAPTVEDIVDAIRAAATVNAPNGKTWVTAKDERVRPTHVEADMTLIPSNVPYVLHKPRGGTETADRPRDPSLTAANRFNCRCQSLEVVGALARSLHSQTSVAGTTVTGTVYTNFTRAAESESARDGGWLLRSAREVAAERAT